jgi:hypothetical protein
VDALSISGAAERLPGIQAIDRYDKEQTMQSAPSLPRSGTASTSALTAKLTRALLACGVVAGPLYILVGVIEMLIRPGFDLRRHSLSLLSNGQGGWIHIAMLITTGLLTIAGAVGIRRVLRGERGGDLGASAHRPLRAGPDRRRGLRG